MIRLQKAYKIVASLLLAALCGMILFLVIRLDLTDPGFSDKTLWDWLDILIVPASLAVFALFIQQAVSRSERLATMDRRREEILHHFLDRIAELIDQGQMESHTRRNATLARTLSVIRTLDAERNTVLLRFLSDSGALGKRVKSDNEKLITHESFISFSSVDLCGVELLGAPLSGTDLERSDLRAANLVRSDMHGAILTEANLELADIREANLKEATLRAGNLQRSCLRKANMERADLSRANLSEADLRECCLINGDLSGATLEGADLRNSNLSGAILRDANLRHVNLKGAILEGADLEGADLMGLGLPFGARHSGYNKVSQKQLASAKSLVGAKNYPFYGDEFTISGWEEFRKLHRKSGVPLG